MPWSSSMAVYEQPSKRIESWPSPRPFFDTLRPNSVSGLKRV